MSEKKKVQFKKACGWCGLDLGVIHLDEQQVPKDKQAEPLVSHGICDTCSEELVTEAEEMFLRA